MFLDRAESAVLHRGSEAEEGPKCRLGDRLTRSGPNANAPSSNSSPESAAPGKGTDKDEPMAIENIARFAGVLARHQGRVVLVLEEYAAWGGAYWNIPSGRVEEHESPQEGARRELAEETSLDVDAADLILCSTCDVVGPGALTRAWNFLAEVDEPRLRVNDPDGIIQDARWFPIEEAAELLRLLPYRPLSEPLGRHPR